MEINKVNNLLELFYYQYQKQNKGDIFLEALKEPRKVDKNLVNASKSLLYARSVFLEAFRSACMVSKKLSINLLFLLILLKE